MRPERRTFASSAGPSGRRMRGQGNDRPPKAAPAPTASGTPPLRCGEEGPIEDAANRF
jgi:hypothetical protein